MTMNWLLGTAFFALAVQGAGQSASIGPVRLAAIVAEAERTHSDGLVIIQHGKVLAQDPPQAEEKAFYIASAGKSLTALAIGALLQEGSLDSLDQPVSAFYPEWRQGMKRAITVRMLLNHTSGLQNHPNASLELEPPPDYQVDDVEQLALCAEVESTPGTVVSYNNKAVALLGGIVERASGKRFDVFFEETFYRPMSVSGYDWIRDRKGTPTTHGAFIIKPSDLAKFGQLMLDKGNYGGRQLVPASFIEEALAPGQGIDPIWGLLWWRSPEWERRVCDTTLMKEWRGMGADEAFIRRFDPIAGKEFDGREPYWKAISELIGPDWQEQMSAALPATARWSTRIFSERMRAYYADGYRGNYLVIVPECGIVGVRCSGPEGFDPDTDGFTEFVRMVADLCAQGKP
jgi:CubicO group peptidase (beta-lactamase class C family)